MNKVFIIHCCDCGEDELVVDHTLISRNSLECSCGKENEWEVIDGTECIRAVSDDEYVSILALHAIAKQTNVIN
jgi:hypothetical protein